MNQIEGLCLIAVVGFLLISGLLIFAKNAKQEHPDDTED